MHILRNETKSQNTKDSLESVTCKMDPPIVSSAYNKMPDISLNINQNLLHSDTNLDKFVKTNLTDKKMDEIQDTINEINVKKAVKRNVLKIPPETLPCPAETKTTTEIPFIVDQVIPIQNEMKFRFQEMNAAHNTSFVFGLVLWSVCFVFFFT